MTVTTLPEKFTDIYRTKDYSRFKHITGNRRMRNSRLTLLLGDIKEQNLLEYYPMLVNQKGEVLDGQTRLACAEHMEVWIYFMIVPNELTPLVIARAQRRNTAWLLEDYLNIYIDYKYKNYEVITNFVNRYRISIGTSIALMCAETKPRFVADEFRNGAFEATSLDFAYRVGEHADQFACAGFKAAKTANFVKAIRFMCGRDDYLTDRMVTKITNHPDKLSKCTSTDAYITMLIHLYNYNSRNKFYFN